MDMDYTNTSNKALIFFVGTQIINIIGLATDYILIQTHNEPITSLCVKYPCLGGFVCGVQFIIPVSLSLHFLAYHNNNYDFVNLP